MSKKDQKKDPIQESPAEHAQAQPSAEADCTPEAETAPDPLVEELEALKNELAEKESKYLRLAAEYDNFRSGPRRRRNPPMPTPKPTRYPLSFPSMIIWSAPSSRRPVTRPTPRVWR